MALHIFEWSGRQQQLTRQDWVTIAEPEDLDQVAARLRAQKRSFAQFPTAIGLAVIFGGAALASQPACARHTLDVSGDGTNNDGIAPELARRDFPLTGMTVNGLVIGANMLTLARYYQDYVIQGPGAFVEAITDYADYESAMKRKLLRELGVLEVSRR